MSDYVSSFESVLGLRYTQVTPDGAQATLDITPKLLQPVGLVHGGVYCAVTESMASVAGFSWLAENGGGNVVGVNNNTDFLRSARSGTLNAVAEPLHRGRRQQLWLVTIADDSGAVMSRGQVRLQNLPHQS